MSDVAHVTQYIYYFIISIINLLWNESEPWNSCVDVVEGALHQNYYTLNIWSHLHKLWFIKDSYR